MSSLVIDSKPLLRVRAPLELTNKYETISTLPNTNCKETQDAEVAFLKKYDAKPYIYTVDEMSTVIYSRTLATHYLWPREQPLTIDALEEFKDIGHTLAIDNTKSYSRIFALDLDCVCRKISNSVNHLSEILVNRIVEVAIQKISAVLMIKKKILVSVWNKGCGFHIYANVFVSLPTHLILKKAIEVEFQHDEAIFEVPSMMPLPYSAKEKNRPYLCQRIINICTRTTPLTMPIPSKYYEMFEYSKLARAEQTIAEISLFSGDTYVTRMDPYTKHTTPRLVQVRSVKIDPNFSYMDQLKTYIENQVLIYNEQITTLGDLDFSDFSESIRYNLQQFMCKINKLFDFDNNQHEYAPDSCNNFIRLCTEKSGGLYMQHFVAGFYLFMNIPDFTEFRRLLRKVFSEVISLNRTTQVFVDMIDLSSMQSYKKYTCDYIIEHLHYLIRHGVDPCDTIDNQINTLLCSISKEASYEAAAEQFRQLPKSKHDILLEVIWKMFTEVIHRLAIVYYDYSAGTYYYINPKYGSFYESDTSISLDNLPPIFSKWLGIAANSSTINTQLKNQINSIQYDDVFEVATTDFMFATKVGIFNVVTGLYSSNIKFLKFNKFIYYGVWDNTVGKSEIYAEQNEHILDRMKIAHKYARMMTTDIFPLYVHGFLAPALIQIRQVFVIEECRMHSLMELLAKFHNYEEAYFLLEYFPIDHKFVYMLLFLIFKYDGVTALLSYSKLSRRIFFNEVTDVRLWKDRFREVYASIKYDPSKESYLEQLMSMTSNTEIEFDEATCFLAVIISVCMHKCRTYEVFVRAFTSDGTINLPPIRKPHPMYHDFEYMTSVQSMTNNVNRAIKIVCGENLSKFETNLIYECFSMNMSTNFTPALTINYLDAIATSYPVTNVHKKFIIFHGVGDAGKSFTCIKLQNMKSPSVVRLRDLSNIARSEITSRNHITIINEAYQMDASILKTITGNDPVSSKRFFSQAYDMQISQSLMYGATNNHISFKRGSNIDVDRTTINRLHCVNMCGVFIAANNNQPNLMTMLTSGQYFKNILPHDIIDASFALGWLSFATYVQRRDANFHPRLDTESYHCREYQKIVYYSNNSLYKFLHNCGLVDEPNFSIHTKELLRVVRPYFDSSTPMPSETVFLEKFSTQYGIDLKSTKFVPNFVQQSLLTHIKSIMHAVECKGSVITAQEYTDRLKVYTGNSRENAANYFERTYQKYLNYETMTFQDLAFTTEPFSYNGNASTDDYTSTSSISPDSLVLKNL